MNQGLSDADFDHDTPKESAAEPGTKAAPAAVAAPKKGGKRVKNKPAKVRHSCGPYSAHATGASLNLLRFLSSLSL